MWWGGEVTRQLEYLMGCCLGEKRAWGSIKIGSLTFFVKLNPCSFNELFWKNLNVNDKGSSVSYVY